MDVEIKMVNTNDIKSIRHQVLWPHLASVEDCVIEADAVETTFHIGAIENNTVVGTSTFMVDENPKISELKSGNQYRLRAMATSPEVRGKGYGEQIIRYALTQLKSKSIDLLWCDARLNATGFYEKLGFNLVGDIYEVPNIGPHKLMYIEV